MKGLFIWQRGLLAVLAVLFSAVMFNQASQVDTSAFWAWIAPLPLLLFAYYGRFTETLLVAFVTFVLGDISYVFIYQSVVHEHLIFYALVGDVIFAFAVAGGAYVCQRWRRWWLVFFLPALWVIVEYLQARLSGYGTLGDVAYTQDAFLPMIQIAGLTGLWGVSFLVVLPANAIAMAILLRKKLKHRFLCWAVPFFILVAVIAYGLARVSEPKLDEHVRAGLVVLPQSQRDLPLPQKTKAYIALIRKISTYQVSVVVMPEGAVDVGPATWRYAYARFSAAAKRYHVMLILGVNAHYPRGVKRKEIWVFNKDGRFAGLYNKNRYYPSMQNEYQSGHALLLLNEQGRWGTALCSDMDFLNLGRRYSQKGAGVVFVLARDTSMQDAYVEAGGAIFRGVEGDFATVRVAQGGIVFIADNRGRVDKFYRVHRDQPLLVHESFSLGHGHSFYSRWGDWFAYLCGLWSLCVILGFFWHRKQR